MKIFFFWLTRCKPAEQEREKEKSSAQKEKEKARLCCETKSDEKQNLKTRGPGRALSLRKKFQNHITMLRNYQTILGLLQNSKREIEIQSVDLDYTGLINLANEMRRLDRVATLVVGGNSTADMVNSIISTSGDRFNIKFAHP